MALIRPSFMSDGATQCAPASAYAIATSLIRSTESWLFRLPSSRRMPQCPWEVYSQRQTSATMYRLGNFARSNRIDCMTGPFGSSAAVPSASFVPALSGTPKRITERRPLRTRGSRWGMSLLIPRRIWSGREGMRVSSSSLSDMKSGYMSIDCGKLAFWSGDSVRRTRTLVNCLSACHERVRG